MPTLRCPPGLLAALIVATVPAQSFLPPPAVSAMSGPTGPAKAGGTTLWLHDLTGDGIPDVVSDPQYTCVVAVGRGDGTFDPTPLNTGVRSDIFTTILGVRDVNGDGLDEVFSYQVDKASLVLDHLAVRVVDLPRRQVRRDVGEAP